MAHAVVNAFNHLIGDRARENGIGETHGSYPPSHLDIHSYANNSTTADDDSAYRPRPALDQDIDTVITTAKINFGVCVILLLLYELLRYFLPEIYLGKLRHAPNRCPESIRRR